MLSGQDGSYLEDFPVKSVNQITASLTVQNSLFLADFDVVRERNITVGDYISMSGSAEGANNFTDRLITDIVETDFGIYIVVDGANLTTEVSTDGVIELKSQWDTWGPGAGLGMRPEEVDIAEHLDIRSKFLSSAEYDFYLKEEIESGKEFLSEQVYNPVSAYALPRKAQASVAYNIGPIPGAEIKTLNDDNVTNASSLQIKRTTNKNFFNTVTYQYEEEALEDRFTRGTGEISADSLNRIKVGNKQLKIQSKGLRELLSAKNIAQVAGERRLKRYKFGAESIKGLKTNFETGFALEIGDKTIVDMGALQMTDIQSGSRQGEPRILEITNKILNLRNGEVTLDLLDTNFDLTQRFGLIAPSSKIKTGISQTEFVIEPTFNTDRFGSSEWRKWLRFSNSEVIIRSEDFTVSAVAKLNQVSSNQLTVQTALGFTPLAGYIIEPSNYSDNTEEVKLVYGSMSDGDNDFADGKVSYKQS